MFSGMCKLRGIFCYVIYENGMLLKIWPHLTFGWPFVNISLTTHPTHSKLYSFVILITSRVIWYTWKVIWSILKFWPLRDSYWEGAKSSKILSKYFWPITISKPSITHFRRNGTWVLLPLHLHFHLEEKWAIPHSTLVCLFTILIHTSHAFLRKNNLLAKIQVITRCLCLFL